jgi:hypothetical protein
MAATNNKKPFLWNEIDLINQMQRIIDAYNNIKYPDTPGEHIHFQAAYPDYVFDVTDQATVNTKPHKLICYDIIKKDDGSLSDKSYSNTTRTRPVLMETRKVLVNKGQPDEKETLEEVYAKRYDLTYRFDCLAPSDKESMELIRIFERMMEVHAEYLEQGCHRFKYTGRKPSYFNRDTQYRSRTCTFFAQTEEHWYTLEDEIKKVNIQYLSINKPSLLVEH